MKLLSSSRLKVFRIFYENPTEEFYIRELGKKIDLSYERIFQYLKELEEIGLLNSRLKGNMKLYSVNMKNEMTLKLFETFETQKKQDFLKTHPDLRGLLERFTKDVLKQIRDKISMIVLFGSVARGKYDKESDIDILVVTPVKTGSVEHIVDKIAKEYSSIYEREIVPITIDTKEFSEGLRTRRNFFQELWTDRIVFYGESKFFDEIARSGVPIE